MNGSPLSVEEDITIASAFPTLAGVSAFKAVLRDNQLTEEDLVGSLVFSVSRDEIMEAVARELIESKRLDPLGDSLPGLLALGSELIPSGEFSARPTNVLRRGGDSAIRSWSDLATLSPARLFAFVNMGEKSVVEVIATSTLESLRAILEASSSTKPAPPVDSQGVIDQGPDGVNLRRLVERSLSTPNVRRWPASSSWTVVAQWLQEATGAINLAEGIDELQESKLPPDVEAAWARILNVRLDELAERPCDDFVAQMMLRIGEELGDTRNEHIFWSRIALRPLTLDELASQFSITRERVRQIQLKDEQAVRSIIDEEVSAPLRWKAMKLSGRLGAAFPEGAEWAQDAIDQATSLVNPGEDARARSLLLWLAGPFHQLSDGWIRSAPMPDRSTIGEAIGHDNEVDVEKLVDLLESSGMSPEGALAWVDQFVPMRIVGDRTYLWEGSVVDKAAILLEVRQEPATTDEIVEMIGEGHGARTTRIRLLEDDRFVRVDRHRIGLRSWGYNEYTGIADELAEEIERQAIPCDISSVVETVATNFGLKISSVRAYTTVPRFIVEDNMIRLRRSNEVFEPRRGLTDEPRCYLVGEGVCSFRLEIDAEVLRGSGRLIPEGLGAWLGVRPGGRFDISFGEVVVPVTWPDSALFGPSIGSLRRVVEPLSVNAGDWILMVIDRDRGWGTVTAIDTDGIRERSAEEQVVALTGIQEGSSSLEQRIADAVGAVGAEDLREKLRRRGENELLDLVPNRAALEDALDRLKELF